ncbi:MAG: ABC transporter permease [Ginsengibacter sp.]
MFKNYFKIAWRNLLRNKGYTFINIIGLAIGLAACLLIFLYVQDELSFDRFNEKADRIYRVNMEIRFGNNHMDLAVANPLFGETAKNDIPQVEDFTRLRWYGGLLVKKGNENIREGNVAWADASLFNVFSLPMISGDPKTALTEPNSMVITETVARKYFNETDVAGRTLLINNKELRKVTGVIKDIPFNSHFQFTVFLPMIESADAKEKTWAGNQNYNTYLLVKPGTDSKRLNDELNNMLDRKLGPDLKSVINKSLEEFKAQGDYFKTSLTALPAIHLHSDKIGELYGSGNIQYVYIFSAIAFFILIIAGINFMNLATARSAKRAREVGVRKVLGSLKSSLIKQFLSEAVLTSGIAMIIALVIATACLSSFNNLSGKQINLSVIFQPAFALIAVALVIIIGILAGLYPAFYLSSFRPVAVLKGVSAQRVKKSIFRNALVVFQFTASIVLITGTMVIYNQLKFIRSKDIGFNRQQMLIINNTRQLGQQIDAFKNELLQLNGVQKATVSGFLPVNYNRNNDSFFPDVSLDTKEAISMQSWDIDENYIPTLEMKVVEGRNFSKDMGTDSSAIILNESAARFWDNKDILNKKVYRITDPQTNNVTEYHVIGVVKDFNYSSLREQVKPLAFMYKKDRGSITVKISGANLPSLLSQIKSKWSAVSGGLPFEYSFMDDDFSRFYAGEEKTGNLFTVFAILAIFIACMGLFGLATFMAEQRTKEIGIRKVLGATVPGISTMLSKDFVRLVVIAIFIATPLAYYIMNKWLQAFAYRIEMQWWVFAIAGVFAISIAIVTVSFQAIKAAIANPVKSLRTE